jgi:hypothetical protein
MIYVLNFLFTSVEPIHVAKYIFIESVTCLVYFKESIFANFSPYSSNVYDFGKCVVYIALARKVCK